MGRLQYIPSFYFYKFANAVADSYTNMEAYRAGLIDAAGNIIGNESSIDPFEYFVIKLKKIFEQLPPGMTRYKLGNLIGTMQLFSEEAELHGIKPDEFNMLVEAEFLTKSNGALSYIELVEDMATGGGAGAIGVPSEAPETNKGNVSGFDPVMGGMQSRSGPMNMIPGVEMFSIPSKEFKMMRAIKSYPKTATGNYLRRYGYRNSENKIAVKDEETGEVHWLPAPNKKTVAEEYGLKKLVDFLSEDTIVDRELIVEEKNRVKKIFRGLINNANRVPTPGENNPTPGTREEHVGRLVHAVRSLHAANSGGKQGIDMFMDTFDSLAGKETSENGFDASEIVADPSGSLSKINLDIKGLSTSPSQRADVALQGELNVKKEMDAIQQAIYNAQEDIKGGNLEMEVKNHPEVVRARANAQEILSNQIPRAKKQEEEHPIHQRLRDYVVDKFRLTGTDVTDPVTGNVTEHIPTSWSIMQPKSPRVSLKLTPKPGIGQEQVPALMSGSALNKALRVGSAFPGPSARVGINTSTKKIIPEIKVRLKDISPFGRQQHLKTTAEDLGTGHLVNADINDQMVETLHNYIGDDDQLLQDVMRHAEKFVR
jgi:hypothetical protein